MIKNNLPKINKLEQLIQMKSFKKYLHSKSIKKFVNNRIFQLFNTYLIDSLEQYLKLGCKNALARKGKILNKKDFYRTNKSCRFIENYERNVRNLKKL